MRALMTRLRLFPLVLVLSLMALAPASCAHADLDAQTVALLRADMVNIPTTPGATDAAALDSLQVIAGALETEARAERPSDGALLDAMQADLKSLGWRVSDGKYRATARTGTVGPWESNIRDAIWRGLYATTQAPSRRLDFSFPHERPSPPLPAARRFSTVAVR